MRKRTNQLIPATRSEEETEAKMVAVQKEEEEENE
jgi:hypothetical protein